MFKFKWRFISSNKNFDFVINSTNEKLVLELVTDLFEIFYTRIENKKTVYEALQYYTNSIEKGFIELIYKYSNLMPTIKRLLPFIKNLKNGEPFYFIPQLKKELDQLEYLKLTDHLRAIKKGIEYQDLPYKLVDTYENILTEYNFTIYGNNRISIGESNKKDRVCRFCNKGQPYVTFKNKAHGISEAIGNKNIILYDECDICNKKFSETIEIDLITKFSFLRTTFNIKGKGGIKKFKGENFKMFNNGKLNIHFYNIDDRPKSITDYNLKLKINNDLISQNIYKTLCKYFISVVDKKELRNFRKTIKWINSEIEVNDLPPLSESISNKFMYSHPEIIYYIRKTENKSLPYAVGELRFTVQTIVFIVPLSLRDNKKFIDKREYEIFWKKFNHLYKIKKWSFNDYSCNNPRRVTFNLNFNND